MTAQDTIAALVTLGVEIDPVNATLVRPPGFTQQAELADLIPWVQMHRSAILSEILEPWQCAGCKAWFFVPAVDLMPFIDSPRFCPLAGPDRKRPDWLPGKPKPELAACPLKER